VISVCSVFLLHIDCESGRVDLKTAVIRAIRVSEQNQRNQKANLQKQKAKVVSARCAADSLLLPFEIRLSIFAFP
jgi:hypothetical protein